MNYHLFIHNIAFMGGGILNLVLPVVVIFLRRKKIDSLTLTFALMSLSVAVFQISQVFGTNAATADISRRILMFNIAVIPINIFMTHWFLALIGIAKKRKLVLGVIYATGAALFLIHLFFPYTYLLPSVPKMYFPFYYEPGSLQWLTRIWFNLVGVYYFLELVHAYRTTQDAIKKNRYAYVLIAIVYAFIVASTAILLVYNIKFDPMWSSLFGFYPLIIAYAVIRYELMDVRVIIERASIYAAMVIAVIGFMSFSNYLTIFLGNIEPGISPLIVPIALSLVGVGLGVIIFRKLRENDLLKYEFVTIIAHKFRTPLTQTKWEVEEMLEAEHDSRKRSILRNIERSNEKLVSLTGTLIDLTNADSTASLYSFKTGSLRALVNGVVQSDRGMFAQKNIRFTAELPAEDIQSHFDSKRLQFVLQTLLENACTYTPENGMVSLKLIRRGAQAVISVSDTGIGIAKKDLSRIFLKFYRTQKAQNADTEGFGIGLYLSQSVAKHHGGKIRITSEGEGKGSVFSLMLPVVN